MYKCTTLLDNQFIYFLPPQIHNSSFLFFTFTRWHCFRKKIEAIRRVLSHYPSTRSTHLFLCALPSVTGDQLSYSTLWKRPSFWDLNPNLFNSSNANIWQLYLSFLHQLFWLYKVIFLNIQHDKMHFIKKNSWPHISLHS